MQITSLLSKFQNFWKMQFCRKIIPDAKDKTQCRLNLKKSDIARQDISAKQYLNK
jgi:hypothetical protein